MDCGSRRTTLALAACVIIFHLCYNKNVTKENNMEDLYPLTLSYTLPSGEKYSVVINNDGQSEDEYHKMFQLCGQLVEFSVD